MRILTGVLPSWGHRPPARSRRGVGSGAPQHPCAAVRGAETLLPPHRPTLRAPPAGHCPGAPPYPASASPPALASRKLPVNSTAFFGRESCRFAASPKGGVDETERYKYARLTVFTTRRRQEQRTVAGLRRPVRCPHLSYPVQSPTGTQGGRGWQPGDDRKIAGTPGLPVLRFGWMESGNQGWEVAGPPSPITGPPSWRQELLGGGAQAGTPEPPCSLAPATILWGQ